MLEHYTAEPSGDYKRPSLHDEVNAREAAQAAVPQKGFKGRFYESRKARRSRRGPYGLTKAEECKLTLAALRKGQISYEERWPTELTLNELLRIAEEGNLSAKDEAILNAVLTMRSESRRGHAAARMTIIAAESHNLQEDLAEFKAETRQPQQETNVNVVVGMLSADERRMRLDALFARLRDGEAAESTAGISAGSDSSPAS